MKGGKSTLKNMASLQTRIGWLPIHGFWWEASLMVDVSSLFQKLNKGVVMSDLIHDVMRSCFERSFNRWINQPGVELLKWSLRNKTNRCSIYHIERHKRRLKFREHVSTTKLINN
jgi:hypothetical protein